MRVLRLNASISCSTQETTLNAKLHSDVDFDGKMRRHEWKSLWIVALICTQLVIKGIDCKLTDLQAKEKKEKEMSDYEGKEGALGSEKSLAKDLNDEEEDPVEDGLDADGGPSNTTKGSEKVVEADNKLDKGVTTPEPQKTTTKPMEGKGTDAGAGMGDMDKGKGNPSPKVQELIAPMGATDSKLAQQSQSMEMTSMDEEEVDANKDKSDAEIPKTMKPKKQDTAQEMEGDEEDRNPPPKLPKSNLKENKPKKPVPKTATDEDEEDNEEDIPVPKLPKSREKAKKPRKVVNSADGDDDDEEVKPAPKVRKKKPVKVNKRVKDEDDEDVEEVVKQKTRKPKQGRYKNFFATNSNSKAGRRDCESQEKKAACQDECRSNSDCRKTQQKSMCLPDCLEMCKVASDLLKAEYCLTKLIAFVHSERERDKKGLPRETGKDNGAKNETKKAEVPMKPTKADDWQQDMEKLDGLVPSIS